MKIACNKCHEISDFNNTNFTKINLSHTDYYLCKKCMEGFWQAVDHLYPPVEIKEKKLCEK